MKISERLKNPWFWVGLGGVILTAMGVNPEMFTSLGAISSSLSAKIPLLLPLGFSCAYTLRLHSLFALPLPNHKAHQRAYLRLNYNLTPFLAHTKDKKLFRFFLWYRL